MVMGEPDNESEVAREGTAAHWVAQLMLGAFKIGGNGLMMGESLIGKKAPNGLIITDEMFDGALTYFNHVIAIVGTDTENLQIEARVSAHHSLDPECFGTADAIYYDPIANMLYIWDFKFGHYSIKAFENWQLIGYAIATCETFKYTKLKPNISLNIVQPRCYDGLGALRTWGVGYDYLRPYVNFMKASIVDYRMNKTKVTSGSWCRECNGRHKCPAIRQAVAVAIDYSTTAIPLDMSNEALGYELDIVEIADARIKQRMEAIRAEAESRVRKGQLVPGRRMRDVFGNRKWSKPDNEIIMLGEMFDVDLRNISLITPAKAEELLKKVGVDIDALTPYIHKPKTGVKLVADDGSRARQIFSQEKI